MFPYEIVFIENGSKLLISLFVSLIFILAALIFWRKFRKSGFTHVYINFDFSLLFNVDFWLKGYFRLLNGKVSKEKIALKYPNLYYESCYTTPDGVKLLVGILYFAAILSIAIGFVELR